jgi:hypothetical protein
MMKLSTVAVVASTSALTLAALVAAPGTAHADRRSFTRTYEYMTMPEGETELEIYSTQSRSSFDSDSPQEFNLQLEIEHGITRRWDISLYHVFEQSSGPALEDNTAFHFSELKLRTRYRFSERGELPVDILAYAEAIKVFGASVYEAELKAILARDFGRTTVAVNAIGAVEFGGDVEETELELGYAAGVTYELNPRWKFGAESWGAAGTDELGDMAVYAGPAISWAPGQSMWVSGTAGFGITDTADDATVRVLIGLHL